MAAASSEWQQHNLGHMQICTLHQTDNHASIPPLSFLHAGCTSCRPTNSVKARATNVHPAYEIESISLRGSVSAKKAFHVLIFADFVHYKQCDLYCGLYLEIYKLLDIFALPEYFTSDKLVRESFCLWYVCNIV